MSRAWTFREKEGLVAFSAHKTRRVAVVRVCRQWFLGVIGKRLEGKFDYVILGYYMSSRKKNLLTIQVLIDRGKLVE